MSTKITKNVFTGGLNTDTDKNSIQPNMYTEAHNVELAGDGVFAALKPLLGTTALETILNDATATVIGAFDNYYKIDSDTNIKCVTVFTASSTLFKIWCYDLQNDDLYELYEKTIDGSYITADRIIDAKAHGENGIDNLYFTDYLNEVRQLRCEINGYAAAPFLSDSDLSLQRRGANGYFTIADTGVQVGGSLLSGTYQFAYRMVDPSTKRFTKWSSLTNPIHVYATAPDSTYRSVAGIGLYSDKKIVLSFTPSAEELAAFDYFQLAVVENIYPIKDSSALPASVLQIELSSDFLSGSTITNYEYKSNTRVNTIPIEDIVVDLAPIKSVKTVNVKQERLFLGNIQYHDLEFDNGNPEVIAHTDSTVVVDTAYEASGVVYEMGRTADQLIQFANNEKLGFQTGNMDMANNQYVHSGGNLNVDFFCDIPWTRVTGVDTTAFSIVKNGSTVLDSDSSVGASGTFNLSAVAVAMVDGDIVDVRLTSVGNRTLIDDTVSFYTSEFTTIKYVPHRRGYFRDEVYRYGIVYFDKYGNKSVPYILDMSNVTGNQISISTDMKFPKRDFSSDYAIIQTEVFDFGSVDTPQVLGLSLRIQNHPSWAVGFEIVRAKRKKRILFQTPVVPMASVKGVGALSNYPSKIFIRNDAANTTQDYPDAQPQTSEEVMMPKNLMYPELRDIIDVKVDSGASPTSKVKGEARFYPRVESGVSRQMSKYDMAAIFPQQTMYGDTPYNFSGGEELETVDFALTKHDVQDFDDVSDQGNELDTDMSTNFYALAADEYVSTELDGLPALESGCVHNTKITEYTYFDNFSNGGVVAGKFVMAYDKLLTSGVQWGYRPNVSKMAVIKLAESLDDNHEIVFGAGTRNDYISGTTGVEIVTTETTEYDDLDNYSNEYFTGASGYDAGDHIQAIRIANIVNNNVGDDRYGDVDTNHEFISTGSVYLFTGTQVDDNTPITVSVWGGDCFVGYHVFKVNDRGYLVIDQKKHRSAPTDEIAANAVAKYDNKFFRFGNGSTGSPISMPVGVKGAAQFIQVYLESEYQGEVMDADILKSLSSVATVPILNIRDKSAVNVPPTYNYNINLSKQNDQKVYLPRPEFSFIQNDFPARFHYSEPKIYNSDIQGFDVFKVLNFYDLSEGDGALTKLAVASDMMYSIQQRAIKYIPTGQNQLEQTDSGTLAVGTSNVIGRPIPIDSKRGGQHLGGIVETGKAVYIPDNINKSVYMLVGQELRHISALNNETLFREIFENVIDEREVRSIYDPIRKQYWLITTENCYVFNEKGIWVGNLEFSSRILGGVYTNQTLNLLGKVGNIISVYSMYTGTLNSFMGTTVIPRVTFIVNPDIEVSKTFDNMLLASTDRLDEVDITVERESNLGNQVVEAMNLDEQSREGSYRIATMRDSDSARLRGLRAIVTVKWKTDIQSTLSSILTKYRISHRAP